MENKYSEKMSNLSNSELENILGQFNELQPEELSAAEEEMSNRNSVRSLIAKLSDDELLELLKLDPDNSQEYNIAEAEAVKRNLNYGSLFHKKPIDQHIIYFATWGKRALARLIDVTIIYVLSEVISGNKVQVFAILGTFLFYFVYYPILESTGGTIGKRIIGIKTVLIISKKSPNILTSYFRSIICLVLSLIPIVNIISYIYLNQEFKQTWWDSGTQVCVVCKTTPKSVFLSRT